VNGGRAKVWLRNFQTIDCVEILNAPDTHGVRAPRRKLPVARN